MHLINTLVFELLNFNMYIVILGYNSYVCIFKYT